jgi:hypothetical protein
MSLTPRSAIEGGAAQNSLQKSLKRGTTRRAITRITGVRKSNIACGINKLSDEVSRRQMGELSGAAQRMRLGKSKKAAIFLQSENAGWKRESNLQQISTVWMFFRCENMSLLFRGIAFSLYFAGAVLERHHHAYRSVRHSVTHRCFWIKLAKFTKILALAVASLPSITFEMC